MGRPDLRAKLQIGQLSVFALSLYPLFRAYGVLGIAWSVTAYSVLNLPAAYFCFRLVELRPSSIARSLLVTTFAAVSGGGCALLCARLLYGYPLAALIAGGISGLAVTGVLLLWLDPQGELASALRALQRLRKTPNA